MSGLETMFVFLGIGGSIGLFLIGAGLYNYFSAKGYKEQEKEVT